MTEPPIESPCVRICIVDAERGLCIGCLRTLSEIAAWGSMSPAQRRAIMDELPSRGPRPDVGETFGV